MSEEVALVETEVKPEVENKESEIQQKTDEPKDEPKVGESKAESEDFIPFPKKAQNALSRKDRTIGKLQARLRAAEQRIAEFSNVKPQADVKKDEGPKESDFETFAEYLEAKALWRVKQEFAERDKASEKANQEKNTNAEKQARIDQRSKEIASSVSEMVKTIPELREMIIENKDFMDSLPVGVQDAFFESENPALAFYNMAKNGTLMDLADMTPYQAAVAIAQASVPVQKTTQAPKPMQGAKGTGTTNDASKLASDADTMRKYLKSKGLM